MSTETTFLKLILPENDEFIDSWDLPVNGNAELIDDFVKAFRLKYDGGTLGTSPFTIQGSTASLQARLAVSINPDGTLNITASPDLVALRKSKVNAAPAVPPAPQTLVAARFEQSDRENFDARIRAVGVRDDPSIGVNYNASISTTNLGKADVALALRHAEFSFSIGVPSPIREHRPNTVFGAQPGYMSSLASTVKANGLLQPILVNIDGYVYRIRYDVILDFSATVGTPGQKRYIFFQRNLYNTAAYAYNRPGWGLPTGPMDLRILQEEAPSAPGTVSMSGNTFTATAGQFAAREVRPGDILIITSGAPGNQGEYIVDTRISNTQLTILGGFPVALGPGSVTWSIKDALAPNFGFVDAAGDPPAQIGRVYVAEGVLAAGGITYVGGTFQEYARNGVYVSPDFTVTAAMLGNGNTPVGQLITTFDHNLGAIPSEIDVFVSTVLPMVDVIKDPTVAFDLGGPTYARMAALLTKADRMKVYVYATDGKSPRRFFTDEAGVDQFAAGGCGLRVIARR